LGIILAGSSIPAFPSGHAIQGAASTTILIDEFGDEFTFVDSAHVGANVMH
jgi:hypothetical protein